MAKLAIRNVLSWTTRPGSGVIRGRTKTPHDKWALRDHSRALASGYSNHDLVEPRNQVRFPRVLKVCKKEHKDVLLYLAITYTRSWSRKYEISHPSCGQSWGSSRRRERPSSWVHSSIIQPSWSPRHRSLAAAFTGDGNVEAPIETW